MLGFYIFPEDPDANVIIALQCCSGDFFVSHDLRYIADQPRPLATGEYAAANRRVGLVIIHVNGFESCYSNCVTYISRS